MRIREWLRARRLHKLWVEQADREHIAWAAGLLYLPPKPQKKFVRDAKGRFACR